MKKILLLALIQMVAISAFCENDLLRKWTTVRGTSMEGSFHKEQDGVITIKGRNGMDVTIRKDLLIKSDQDYVDHIKPIIQRVEIDMFYEWLAVERPDGREEGAKRPIRELLKRASLVKHQVDIEPFVEVYCMLHNLRGYNTIGPQLLAGNKQISKQKRAQFWKPINDALKTAVDKELPEVFKKELVWRAENPAAAANIDEANEAKQIAEKARAAAASARSAADQALREARKQPQF